MTKINIDRAVVEQALDALEGVVHAHGYKGGTPVEAITALRQALEQPAQQETSSESAYQRGYLDGMAKPCIECADRKEQLAWEAVAADQAMTIALKGKT